MRKEQKGIDGLGPIGIVREAFKFFSTHYKFSLLIQLTLILPVTIVTVITECAIYANLPERGQPTPGTSSVPLLSSKFRISFLGGASGLQQSLNILLLFLASAVSAIFVGAVEALSAATILYAVGLNYTGQSISFRDVLLFSIPGFWMRLTVTKIYEALLLLSVLLVQTQGSLLLIRNHLVLSGPVMLLGVTSLAALGMLGVGCLQMVFRVANGVSVLEKDYGWAALRRSSKLLKGRVIVAILFQLLWLVPTVVTIALHRGLQYLSTNVDFSPPRVTALVLGAVVYTCWMTFVMFMTALCTGVQYVSFKTYHNEDLAESIHEKQTMKPGYERVGGESDDTKVGKQADNLV